MAKAASAIFKTFQIEGNQGGALAASIDATASGDKEMIEQIMLKPTQNGWVQSGRLYDIIMKDAQVGAGTHVSTDSGLLQFFVEDISVTEISSTGNWRSPLSVDTISVEIKCKYDLRP